MREGPMKVNSLPGGEIRTQDIRVSPERPEARMEGPTLFEGVSIEELEQLLGTLDRRTFAPGEVLLQEGETPGVMYLLRSGLVEVFVRDGQGGEQTVGHAGSGDALGDMSLITGQPASATARALTHGGALAITREQFHAAAAAYPQVYRSLAAILSSRLARTNQRVLRGTRGRVAILRDDGAPPDLAYALACSAAWHTRGACLLVCLHDGDLPPALAELSGDRRSPPPASLTNDGRPVPHPGAWVMPARPSGLFAPAALGATLDHLRTSYDLVLLWVRSDLPVPADATRTIRLGGAGAECGRGEDYAVRAWLSGNGHVRADRDGAVNVEPLSCRDRQHLASGYLAPRSSGGGALGWVARDLAGLKVGIAFGGGGARGYAHLGVHTALSGYGVPFDYVGGTSVGAPVAAGVAMGYGLEDSLGFLDSAAAATFRPTLPVNALLSCHKLEEVLRSAFRDWRFEDLRIPTAVVATDLKSRREVVFRRGEITPALLASMAIPGIYGPQCIGPYTLVDGGVVSPIPTRALKDMGADIVIGVQLGRGPETSPIDAEAVRATGSPPRMGHVILRSVEIMQTKLSQEAGGASEVLIPIDFEESSGWGLKDFGAGRRYVGNGQSAAEEALGRLAARLPWLREK